MKNFFTFVTKLSPVLTLLLLVLAIILQGLLEFNPTRDAWYEEVTRSLVPFLLGLWIW